MTETTLNNELNILVNEAVTLGYKVNKPIVKLDSIYGNKLGYYAHRRNEIVIHDHYADNADTKEVMQTLRHELAHAIAEQNNTEKKAVWHGQVWKDILIALGGDAERYHVGSYSKPAFVKKTMKELYAILPTKPADTWERGTYKQWLTRGYHVMKGQKGQLVVWEFSADEYETDVDGKTADWGRASAVYFTPDQVEPNTRKEQ